MPVTWKKVYKKNARQMHTKLDILVCYIHYLFARRGFRCVGVGDFSDHGAPPTLMLPAGWNESEERKLRYLYYNMTHVVHFTMMDEDIIAVKVEIPLVEEEYFEVFYNLDHISHTTGPLRRMMPCYKQIYKFTNDELIDWVIELTRNSVDVIDYRAPIII